MGSFRPDPNLIKKHPNAITQAQIDEKGRFLGALLGAAAAASNLEPTLLLLRSLASRRRLDLDDFSQALVRWLGAKPQAVGRLTRSAIENLRAGEPPSQSGAIAWEDSGRKAADDEGLAYGAPVALLHVRDLDGLSEDAAAASRVTHADPRCVGACAGVATAVALLVRGGTDAEEAIVRAATAAGTFSDDALRAIERGAAKKPAELRRSGEPTVLHTLEIAFSALASAGSFADGLAATAPHGIGASIAGALLGAKFGKAQLPDLSKLAAAAELISLGEKLYAQG